MSITLGEARAGLEIFWKGHPAWPVAEAVLALIEEERPSTIRFADVVRASGRDVHEATFLTAMAILTQSTAAILDASFVLREPDGTERPLTGREYAEAERTGRLLSSSGESFLAACDRLVPVFSLRPGILEPAGPRP